MRIINTIVIAYLMWVIVVTIIFDQQVWSKYGMKTFSSVLTHIVRCSIDSKHVISPKITHDKTIILLKSSFYKICMNYLKNWILPLYFTLQLMSLYNLDPKGNLAFCYSNIYIFHWEKTRHNWRRLSIAFCKNFYKRSHKRQFTTQ